MPDGAKAFFWSLAWKARLLEERGAGTWHWTDAILGSEDFMDLALGDIYA